MVEFSDWKADPQLPASTFAFEPPKGATRIEFRSPAAEAAR
jgi:outer membrane lipoprotein-sorting protein